MLYDSDVDDQSFEDAFTAKVTAVTSSGGIYYYDFLEQQIDPSTGGLQDGEPGRSGAYADGTAARERNNLPLVNFPTIVDLRFRGVLDGLPIWEFDAPEGSMAAVGGGSLTVEELDGVPSYTTITTIEFNQGSGFALTQPAANQVLVSFVAATTTQQGAVSTTTQVWAGQKEFTHNIIVGSLQNPSLLTLGSGITSGQHGSLVLSAIGSGWTTMGMSGQDGGAGALSQSGSYILLEHHLHRLSLRSNNSDGTLSAMMYSVQDGVGVIYDGGTAVTGGLTFKGGLYTGGTATGGGAGTMTSVTLVTPAGLSVNGGSTATITTTGTFTLALADDLGALEALTGTSTIYYRSAASTWSAVTVGSGLDFTTGTLTATGAGSNVFKGALVKLTSNQSVATTGTTLSWHVATYDTSAFWSAGAPTRLTVPTGVTRVRLKGGIDIASSTAGSRQLVITKNGGFDFPGVAQATWSNPAYGDTQMAVASPVFDVVAGDYFELFTKSSQSGLNALGTANQTWFSIEVVSTEAAAGSHTHSAADITSGTLSNARLDSTLGALAVYNTNGLLTQTAADTFVGRTLTGPAAGLTVTAGDGVAGNPTLALADDLAALEALTGTNTIYYRSGTSAWSAVTIGANLTFSGGTLAAGAAVFVAAGGSHAAGTVPDPGATSHSNFPYSLRDDATFKPCSGEFLATPSTVATSETTGSTTPVGLATAQVLTFTLDATSYVWVTMTAGTRNTTAAGVNVIYAEVSGATTVAATTIGRTTCTNSAVAYSVAGSYLFGPLNAGSNSITLKFSTSTTTTATFLDRSFSVQRV